MVLDARYMRKNTILNIDRWKCGREAFYVLKTIFSISGNMQLKGYCIKILFLFILVNISVLQIGPVFQIFYIILQYTAYFVQINVSIILLLLLLKEQLP